MSCQQCSQEMVLQRKLPWKFYIPFNSLQNLGKELKIIGDTALRELHTDLQESVYIINKKFQEYTQVRREKEREIKELKENSSTHSKSLDNLDYVIERQEQPSQHFNVGSTLFQRCGSRLKWGWPDVENETKSDVGISTLHNVDITSVSDAETKLIQLYLDVVSTWSQR